MTQEWNAYLASQGKSSDGLDFGQLANELKQAQAASIITPLQDLRLIRVSGADATDFLHNLLTNDVEGLTPDSAMRYGFCTPKGRLLATFLIWRDTDDFLLALAADLHESIFKKLSMYVLRSRVKLSDASEELVLLGCTGPQATAALTAASILPAPLSSSSGPFPLTRIPDGPGGSCVIRLAEERFIVALPPAAALARWTALTASDSTHRLHPAGLHAWHWLEITAGIPQITAATQEEFIPQMANYEIVGGVSFKKGCYPGQEIVARTQYLGKIKRRMYRIHLETGTMATGSPIFSPETGDQPCGMIVMAAPAPDGGEDALAVIQTSCAESNRLHLGARDGTLLTQLPLPYKT
jgi:folate-binding protein YgfZ